VLTPVSEHKERTEVVVSDGEAEEESNSETDSDGGVADRQDSNGRELFSHRVTPKAITTSPSRRTPISTPKRNTPATAKAKTALRRAAEEVRQDDQRARQQRGWHRWGAEAENIIRKLFARSLIVFRQLKDSNEEDRKQWEEQLDRMCQGREEMGMDFSDTNSLGVLALLTALCDSLGENEKKMARRIEEYEDLKKEIARTQEQQRKAGQQLHELRLEVAEMKEGRAAPEGEERKAADSSSRQAPTAQGKPKQATLTAIGQQHAATAPTVARPSTNHSSTDTSATQSRTTRRTVQELQWGVGKAVVSEDSLGNEEQRSTIFTITQQRDWQSWEASQQQEARQAGNGDVQRLVLSAYFNRSSHRYRVGHSSVKNGMRARLLQRHVERVEVRGSSRDGRINQAVIVWKTVRARQIAMESGRYTAFGDDIERIQMWWNGDSSEWRSARNHTQPAASPSSRNQPRARTHPGPQTGQPAASEGGWQKVLPRVRNGGRAQQANDAHPREAPALPPPRERVRIVEPIVVQPPPPAHAAQQQAAATSVPSLHPLPTRPTEPRQQEQPCQTILQHNQTIPNVSQWQQQHDLTAFPAVNPTQPTWPMPPPSHALIPPSLPQLPFQHSYQLPYQPPIHEQRQHLFPNFQFPHHYPLPSTWWGQSQPMGGMQ
jgi:hypothetical protein